MWWRHSSFCFLSDQFVAVACDENPPVSCVVARSLEHFEGSYGGQVSARECGRRIDTSPTINPRYISQLCTSRTRARRALAAKTRTCSHLTIALSVRDRRSSYSPDKELGWAATQDATPLEHCCRPTSTRSQCASRPPPCSFPAASATPTPSNYPLKPDALDWPARRLGGKGTRAACRLSRPFVRPRGIN